MSEVVIRAEGLGKKYLIGHQAERERYTALRDVLGRGLRGLARSAGDMLRGRQLVAGNEVEEFWALSDVSFEVKRGEVVGIIGRNGAGKSTLLKILSRITEPSAGRVTIRGRVASLLEVGTGFHPELTGRENIYLNGAILGMSRAEIRRKFDEIVAFAEIERFLDTPVKRYSSGMYVRLAFAVAAHLEPEILVVDEVLAVGDAEFQRKCLGKMRDVAGQGRTVLFVSHNMGAVAAMCQLGLVLSKGNVTFRGPIQPAILEYVNLHHQRAFEARFDRRSGKPSITGIKVDPAGLERGDIVVSIEFSSPTPLSDAVGGIVLRSATGVPVWGSNSRFHKAAPSPVAVSNGQLVCEVRDLPLAPGPYALSVWLGGWYEDYDDKLDVLTIPLRPNVPAAARPSSEMIGFLDWQAKWELRTDHRGC